MPIQFNQPTPYLITLAASYIGILAWLLWCHRRSLTDLSGGRKRWALGLRISLVTLLFLAIADTRFVRRRDALAVIYVMDASQSMRQPQRDAAWKFIQDSSRAKRASDRVGLVTFGADPEIKTEPDENARIASVPHSGEVQASNVEQAVQAAIDLIPRDMAGKVVLLSDGNENAGSALAAAPSAGSRGIRFEAAALPPGLEKEALVEKVLAPAQAKIGEPFTVRVIVHSLNRQNARVTLRRDGKIIAAPKDVELSPGRRAYDFEVGVDQAGAHRIEVSLETDSSQDTLTENNRGMALVNVRGRPQVLYVSMGGSPPAYLQRALSAQKIDLKAVPPDVLPTTPAAFQGIDSVVISDVPTDLFTDIQLNALQSAVRDFGMGFCMVGGENSYGLGGYRQTVVEDMLPVTMEIRDLQRFPPVCVAMVIDRSGSMMEGTAGGDRKIDLAIKASMRAVQALKPTDKMTVVTFDAMGEVQVPLTTLQDPAAVQSKLQQIGPGGGTVVYAGVAKAWEEIKKDTTPIKHMIVLTDGMTNDPDYTSLLAEMKKQKVTITGVLIDGGTGASDPGVLGYLAKQTGGRYYAVKNAKDIPRIYLQEIERISSRPIVEEPFFPTLTPGAQSVIPSLAASYPTLLGYNVTHGKPNADMLLKSHRNDPILGTWRYGLGRSVAFTSDDKNKWAANWLGWGGFPRFWAEAIRWSMRTGSDADLAPQITLDGAKARVRVDALNNKGEFMNGLNLTAKVAGPSTRNGLQPISLPLRQIGPGIYEGEFDAPNTGSYLVNVSRPTGSSSSGSSASLVIPYSPEYRDLDNRDFLLEQLTGAGGGAVLNNPKDVFEANRPIALSPIPLAPTLLLLSLFLLPIDVGVRRLALQREDWLRAREWLSARLRGRKAVEGRSATPEMARLRGAKGRAGVQAPVQPVAATANGQAVGTAPAVNVQATGNPPQPTATLATTPPVRQAAPTTSTAALRASRTTQTPEPKAAPVVPPLATQSPTVAKPPVIPPASPTVQPRSQTPTPPIEDESGTGMSRLLAAKKRAREDNERQK